MDQSTAPRRMKIAVFCYEGVGHMNPMLNIVAALCNKGAEVHVFGPREGKEEIEAAGAIFRYYFEAFVPNGEALDKFDEHGLREKWAQQFLSKEEGKMFAYRSCVEGYMLTKGHIQALEDINPDVVVYDTFYISVWVGCKVLGIENISVVTFSGLGIFTHGACQPSKDCGWADVAKSDTVSKYGHRFEGKWGINPFKEIAVLQAYSDNINIVTLLEDMTMKIPPNENEFNYQRFSRIENETLKYVGPCISQNHRMKRNITAAATPAAEMEKILAKGKIEGRKIIFFSLGTVVTTKGWDGGLGMSMSGTDTGKDLFYTLNTRLTSILGDNDAFLLISVVGPYANISELPLYSNVHYIPFVNQLQVLASADVFLSHCGAGSTGEAVAHGVPVIPLPVFADQSFNGQLLVENGVAVMPWDPLHVYTEATTERMKFALDSVLSDKVRNKSTKLKTKMKESGGQQEAADIIINCATATRRNHILRRTSSSACSNEIRPILSKSMNGTANSIIA